MALTFPVFAQDGGGEKKEGPSQIEIAATGIAEIYKKDLKLSKEQYADLKQAYLKFLYYQAYNPGVPGIGCEKLEKTMTKILDEEQFKKWRAQDPNRPLTEAQKAEYKAKKKKLAYGETVRMSQTPPPADAPNGGAPAEGPKEGAPVPPDGAR